MEDRNPPQIKNGEPGDPGFNPLKWDCHGQGCWKHHASPKIEIFCNCFPRKINFTDIDGFVEIAGHFCILEWKTNSGKMGMGQKLCFKRFTERPPGYEGYWGNIVFVVHGNPITMEVKGFLTYWEGNQYQYPQSNLEELKSRIAAWAQWCERRPVGREGTITAEELASLHAELGP